MFLVILYPVLSAVFLVVFCGIFFVLFSPIYVFRFLLAASAKYIRKDFGNILAARSSIYGVDEIYRKPTSTIVCVVMVQETIDFEKFRKNMESLVLTNKNLVEMTQYVEYWLGFCFWRKDKDFKISNYVREYNSDRETMDDKELEELRAELLAEPFQKKRSPWEFIIVHNYRKNAEKLDNFQENDQLNGRDLAIFKFHHSLGDGASLINFIFETSFKTRVVTPNYQKQNGKMRRWWDFLKFFLISPGEIFMAHIFGESDENEWHKDEKDLSKDYFATGKNGGEMGLTVEDIKAIKKHFHVGFQPIIYAGIAGSIGKTMKQLKILRPEMLKVVTQVPIPGYKGGLTNRFGVEHVSLPIGETDSVKRLKLVHNQMEEMRQSTLPYAFFLVIKLIGSLFTFMVKPLGKLNLVTAAVSSFAGPTKTSYLFDLPIVDLQFSVGLLQGNIGIGFYIITYNGKLTVGANVDRNVCSDPTVAAKLANNFLEELHNWRKKSEL